MMKFNKYKHPLSNEKLRWESFFGKLSKNEHVAAIWATQSQIAEKLGVSIATVRRHTKRLVESGLFYQFDFGGKHGNRFIIVALDENQSILDGLHRARLSVLKLSRLATKEWQKKSYLEIAGLIERQSKLIERDEIIVEETDEVVEVAEVVQQSVFPVENRLSELLENWNNYFELNLSNQQKAELYKAFEVYRPEYYEVYFFEKLNRLSDEKYNNRAKYSIILKDIRTLWRDEGPEAYRAGFNGFHSSHEKKKVRKINIPNFSIAPHEYKKPESIDYDAELERLEIEWEEERLEKVARRRIEERNKRIEKKEEQKRKEKEEFKKMEEQKRRSVVSVSKLLKDEILKGPKPKPRVIPERVENGFLMQALEKEIGDGD